MKSSGPLFPLDPSAGAKFREFPRPVRKGVMPDCCRAPAIVKEVRGCHWGRAQELWNRLKRD